ncbi:MAG: family 20 glycosylhydrolase [Bacteroidetes bacterium]|nr:family 20 glycosylhydrolase [Bacteroidota bacterium]
MRTLLLWLLAAAAPAFGQELPLMPWPSHLEMRSGQLPYLAPLQPRVEGPTSERATQGIARWSLRLSEKAGPGATGESRNGTPLQLRYRAVADLNDPAADGSYTLTIDNAGITVDAATDIGALHALATLYQCLRNNEGGWSFPALRIEDKPRFTWRGLMVDPCRHFMPRSMILRQLDGMELVKMNVLHLHLTDDQGFRIESKLLPELQEKGSNGQYYSQADIRKIIHEADLRGIRVVPEFDLPGHATSWFQSHPELASAAGPYQPETRYGVMDPVFDPTNEAVYALLDTFLGEMAALFPDPCMHIGGDENNGNQWNTNPAIQAFMKKNGIADNHALQAYFNGRLYAILKKHGKRMLGWDEIGEMPAGSAHALPQDVSIQCWRGKQGLLNALKAGRDAILSNGWYIDLCQSTAFHYLNDSLPADADLDATGHKHLLGGEATMWAELVDARNVDTRIWPRTAAIAERLWSPATVTDVPGMYRRLETASAQLEAIGMQHKTAQAVLLRMITGNDDITALKQLVDVLQPVQGYKRHQLAVHTTRTPLTGLADAAVPDPARARRIAALIDHLLQSRDTADAAALRMLLGTGSTALPCCNEIVQVRAQLEQSALEAVSALIASDLLKPDACARFKHSLEKANGPFLECEFADLAAFRRLYGAACAAGQ